jgi:MFS family permease
MLIVLKSSWALLLGLLLLMAGNGLHGTLLGIRGSLEGLNAATMSLVMSAYYLGMLIGSRRATTLIRRVGHVRVFAALASLISAAFIIYPAIPNAYVWIAMRLAVGFCFAGVFVVAESWLNEAATNETRGQALSLYMIVQMVGIIAAQGVLNLGDPSGYVLFIIMSVLVSVSFAPILLSVSPAPAFQTAKPMTLIQLFQISPLGCVGTFLLGGVLAGSFGMSAVFGTEKGMTVAQISAFVAAIYLGGLLCQVPIGWVSDRMDRRWLIMGLTAFGALATLAGMLAANAYAVVIALGFVIGGVANPMYSLLIAYTNDFLDSSDMPAASGGLLFINGLGAIGGPVIVGALMTRFGADMYFLFVAVLLGLIALYAAYRMTRRPSPSATDSYVSVLPEASPVAVEVAQEVAIERAGEAETQPVAP